MKRQQAKKQQIKWGIQAKVLGILLPAVVVIISTIVVLFYNNASNLIIKTNEEKLKTDTNAVVSQVSGWLNETITAVKAERDAIEYFNMSVVAEKDYLKHAAGQYAAFPAGIYFATTDGDLFHATFVPDSSYNVFEKSWYQDGLLTEDLKLSSTYMDSDSKQNVASLSGMLKDRFGLVRGVVAADIYLSSISEIVKPIQLEDTGAVFLVDGKTNIIIGSKESELLGKPLGECANDMYKYIEGKIRGKDIGLTVFKDSAGRDIYINLQTIPGSDWVAAAYVPKNEVMRDLNSLARVLIIMSVLFIGALALIIVVLVRRSMILPVRKINHVAERIANGNLNETIDVASKDEFGVLAGNFNLTVSRLREYVDYIDEVSGVLVNMGNGALDIDLKYKYDGDFAKIKAALYQISNSLKRTIGQITEAADQVSVGSDQIASGAQALSQGATEQASSIEELAATVHDINEQVSANAKSARHAGEQMKNMGYKAIESNEHMKQMLGAMADISSTSSEIGKIVKNIEDIAFQTNILALNAAVEAARAGAAGKGFAVVADEVRNLANKSAEASKITTALIEKSVHAVDNGKRIADQTADTLSVVVKGIGEISSTITSIESASAEQSVSISQVTQGMEQISSIVQTNSATSEESAAASEELAGQAQTLKGLMNSFSFKRNY